MIVSIPSNYNGTNSPFNLDGPEIMPLKVDPGAQVFVKVKKENSSNYLIDEWVNPGNQKSVNITEAGNYIITMTHSVYKDTIATKTITIKESGYYCVSGTPYGFQTNVGDLRAIVTCSFENFYILFSNEEFNSNRISNNGSGSTTFDKTFYNLPVGDYTFIIGNPGYQMTSETVKIEKGKLTTYQKRLADPPNPEQPGIENLIPTDETLVMETPYNKEETSNNNQDN